MPFDSSIAALWLPDGRMQLIEPLSFTDAAGRVWRAPVGFITDGASIPRAFWSLIGGPFDGPYRTAAVLHDVAYCTPGVRKDDADLMLLEACLELGCPRAQAEAIYQAVKRAGEDAYMADQRAGWAALGAPRG